MPIHIYGRWLGYLMAQGVALEAVAPPDRITAASVDGYVRFLAKRCATVTVASYLGQLHMMVSAVWPDHDWRWLCAIQARRHRMAEPVRNKAARIVPQQDLLALGCELMVKARAMAMPNDMRAGPNHPAILHRDGLMIALLAMRPLRQSNLLGLQLHRQLRREGDGWVITLTDDETKAHDRLVMAVPVVLLPELERYLDLYRARLMDMTGPTDRANPVRPPGQFLWITRCGTPMTAYSGDRGQQFRAIVGTNSTASWAGVMPTAWWIRKADWRQAFRLARCAGRQCDACFLP